MPRKFKDAYEEAGFMRAELKKLMSIDPVLQNIRTHFLSLGIDKSRVDIVVNQAFNNEEKRKKILEHGKKFFKISLIFLFLFLLGVGGWFFIYGDWIDYFAGLNLVAFLYFILKSSSMKSEAAIYAVD